MIRQQREVYAALNASETSHEKLPTVAMTTQWQLEDSIALRNRAKALLKGVRQ
ncbi:hypothetical protein Plhal304r1_c079g0165591 [Plasmopara halstedii]